MVRRVHLLAAGLLALSSQAAAAVDCSGDVLITSARDAKEVRDSCTVVKGNLDLAYSLDESINLDGLERVEGDITHEGCGLVGFSDCFIPSGFNFTSSTLSVINGSLDFNYFYGLTKIILPKLNYVEGTVSLLNLFNITELDFTNLEYISEFFLKTERLQTLQLNGIKGFTRGIERSDGIQILDAGSIESLDGFFKYPINTLELDNWAMDNRIQLDINRIPKVRNITIGWTGLNTLDISGKDLTVILGRPSTKSMEIRNLDIGSGVSFQRADGLQNLTVGDFTLHSSNLTKVSLPFDDLASLSLIFNDVLTSIELPPEAKNWRNLSMDITLCESLNLTSEYDDDGKQTWYWPKGDLHQVHLNSNISTEFL
ncbi:hypothetical protein QQZ08_010896 [Neonectria magnoliae]|uniref:Uncharacterized protein n=1 Tax=Neonectria magnoliae TaxID=2732573 RepID=A0ABR1HDW6_9HYPO